MALKNQITGILEQEMDRKSFLKYSGSLIIAAVGISGFMRLARTSFSTSEHHISYVNTKQAAGYGSSEYGS